MARLFALVLAFVAYASAFSGPASVGAVSRASVAMSTKFTDPYVQKMKKKNPKTGSTTNLKGYTVGSRAPPMAVSSGTRITTSYKLEANVVKSDGNLRGKGANTQNVPTAAVIVVPTLLLVALKAFSGQL